jgi:hypothetical protein
MKYAIGYRNTKGDLVCELFPDWPSMFKRLERLETVSKTVFEVVQGENGPIS